MTDAAVDGNTLLLTIDSGGSASDLLTLEVCQDNILRVDYQPESVEPSPDTPIIDPELTWDTTTATEIDITGDPIVIQTDGMRIEISRTPCRMTVMQADGTTLFWEPESGGIYHDGVRFVRAESSNMYGIHGFDCFSDNGNLLRNDNSSTAAAGQQGNSGGPFMWSTAGYGILVDSDGGYPYTNSTDRKMEFYYGGTPAEGRRYEKEDVEYFIMLGEPKEIMAGFSKITETSPMMPKWSLGFSNFEWDIDEDEFYEMVELYRAKNIPIDGYAFDYDWKRYGDDNYGEFTWNTDNFPSAASTQLKEDKVANAGDYDVTFRYANGDAAEKSLSVYVNGSYIGKTAMPSTGDWDTWADCLMQLPLAAGNNIITLKHEDASGDTGYVNLDSCTVPFYPEVITAEAENAALYGTAGTNQDHWNYSGSGFVDGMTSAGAGAEFEITVPKDGSYEASIRYCNGTQATKDLNLYVNGSYIETISFGSIGGNWNEWQELTQTLELDEGRNVVALRYDSSNSGNVNLDKLSVKTEPDATISVPLVDNGGFERDTSQSSAWTEWHPDGQAVAYGVDSGSGTNPPESPYAGDKRVYFYSSSAYQQSIHQGINLPNGTYTVQAWIKVSNTAPDIGRMEVTGYGGDSIYVDMPYAGTGWRLVETDITVTTGYLDIGFYCSSLGGTTVHIDNVKILNK